MSPQENRKVSICMITYNHQEYIGQALDSILNQKTTFPFEIVIGDDNSKDDTQKICLSYAAKFPEKVKYHRREKNMGMMPNMIDILSKCDGKYIALCEGDDYWTDENKLQTQANFLDDHPDASLCCHNHFVLTNNQFIPANKDAAQKLSFLTTEDYLLDPFFHTSSYFFRNSAQPTVYPEWYNNVLAGDHFLVLFLSMKGKIGYIDKKMSVFRNHGKSVSFTRAALDIKENFVYHLEKFDQYSNEKFQQTIHRVIQKWNVLYKVYEPVGYFKKLGYLFGKTKFYMQNFKAVGGLKLLIKYLVPGSVLRQIRG